MILVVCGVVSIYLSSRYGLIRSRATRLTLETTESSRKRQPPLRVSSPMKDELPFSILARVVMFSSTNRIYRLAFYSSWRAFGIFATRSSAMSEVSERSGTAGEFSSVETRDQTDREEKQLRLSYPATFKAERDENSSLR